MALETELRHFESVRNELVQTHQGQFALVAEDRVEGLFTTFAEAYEAGVRLHGFEPFLVRQITAEDAPILLPALNAGVIFGR